MARYAAEDSDPDDDKPHTSIEVILGYVGAMGHGVGSFLLLSPSLAFTVSYGMISVGAVFLQGAITHDWNGPLWNWILAIVIFPVCIFGTVMFYIQQTRELKRFYEQ